MIYTDEKLAKLAYKYLGSDFKIESWDEIKEYLEKLIAFPPQSAEELVKMLYQYSELSKAMGDELSWRYIRMTLNADNEDYANAYNEYFADVASQAEPYRFQIKKMYYESAWRKELDPQDFAHLDKIIANEIELYRAENIPLKIQESELANKYGSIISTLTAHFEGEDRTVSQLSVFLKDGDRAKREAAWRLIWELYSGQANELDKLYDDLREVRGKIAVNAGYDNFRDYMHSELGRFSYSPEDLYKFHDAVEKVVIPFVKELDEQRKEALKLEQLRPWDGSVDLDGRVLKPFAETAEFIEKSVKVLSKVSPAYAKQLEMMGNSGLLDLENRKGKAPGGYNTGINELGSSFIFMNHVKQHNDVVTLLHEAGHAMHSQATAAIPIVQYLDTPSEVAELASMSMELLTMDYWDEFYTDATDLKKAKRDQLEGTLTFLPWAMTVDAFQHWVYLNPQHSPQERCEAYLKINKRFSGLTDWTGLEDYRKYGWIKQLHIFEVPFYYIEYGMAQLGALSVYKNYRENKARALRQYQDFLSLGYSKPVSELYRTAGIDFDFSEGRIRELVDFVRSELAEIEKL